MSAQTWQRGNNPQRVSQSTAMRSASGPAAPNQQRQRNDGKSDWPKPDKQILTALESWVEVSSHPSSSSVSSIGDEIVTTGLQVGSSYHGQRRRRLHPQSYARSGAPQPTFVAGQVGQTGTSSSQEEYEESESEDDRVLTSSAENIASPQAARSTPLRQVQPIEPESSDDDDDRATALGTRPPEQPFQPQPNAFSHPPSHLLHRHSTTSSLPQHHRPSFGQRSQTRVDRRSPNYQADNDAALRASLTTLLSCAAAAGRRSKDGEKEIGERSNAATGNQPISFRFATETDLMEPPPSTQTRGVPQPSRPSPQAATNRESAGEKVKRSATPTPNTKSRTTKKKRTNVAAGEEAFISPTLLTWVVSAGVVVLVSVVGFGAGYVIGREVGRQETLNGLGAAGNASAVAEGSNCGREVIRSGGGTLKRFRWGTAMGRSVAA
ncbi:uncharacterized protein F4807DRAFT_456396 [Annulohypoxylon truncatum]|uniref:uncharacterized protein n=1 Tax=Annulohypoxylon truncatum TaxID=327061 RepID=UPI002008B1C1|nr:uncharacterized protein F4807DRAFT_456396 [Annulohypoxylon truncatum]KAI1213850.1 hypothetical protein F4807DRAFT_456396 [Annulohypoxylon truncatum]